MTYTAGDTLIKAVMTADSGLPEDEIVNTFSFKWGSAPSSGDYATMCGWVADFYEDVTSSGYAPGQFISSQVDRGSTHELQAYVIASGPLGSPVYTQSWIGPPSPTSGDGIPTECAAVLAFHADLTGIPEESGVTRPRARRRGRVFIGPLTPEAIAIATPPFMLEAGFRGTLNAAAVNLKTASTSRWAVWSRENATLYPVYAGWTDNAPDTQRRRGPASTARSVWGP